MTDRLDPPPAKPFLWQAGRFRWTLQRPLVMGIVNATPDSFSDGGRHASADAARRHCDRLLAEGADILDIGGASTRPGAVEPSVQEETDRVMPVVEHAVTLGCAVSVDTSVPVLMREALAAGADIVNDVRALRRDGACAAVAAHPSAGVCLMHLQGEPATMQQAPRYDDVVAEVGAWLQARLDAVVAAGIDPTRIVLDPGFGFGKSLDHNLALMAALGPLGRAWGRPLLVGWSRKGTLGRLTGRAVDDRLVPSVAAALAAVAHGARVLRVHDVAPTVDALKVWAAMGPPPRLAG